MITLTSDFGLKDPYVSEMKGVILTINPKTTLIDITHDIEKFNIRMAAFTLASAAPYFPKGAVHLAVVDPGVGTQRRAIIIQTERAFFVGPDNGILILAAQGQTIKHIYQITNPKFMRTRISNTFHGRDIFSPAAAYLDKGVEAKDFGPEIKEPIKPAFGQVRRTSNSLIGEVMHIDGFGNIITNICEKDLAENKSKTIKIELPHSWLKLSSGNTYAEAKPKEPVALIGSHGFLEIALDKGSAASEFHAEAGDKVTVTFA
jgi:S-adenosylmethionine hydrolase